MVPEENELAPGASGSRAQILRSTSIIGGATAISMLLGLIRGKVVAVLLGPAGLGLLGLLNNLMTTTANVASLGIGTSGVRHIAEAAARGDGDAVARARSALFVGMGALAVIGGGIVWLSRDLLAHRALGDLAFAPTVGWLALGVALLVASGSQGALLNGLRRTGDLARVSIGAAVLTSVVGIGSIVVWRDQGLIPYLLAGPAALLLMGYWYVARLKFSGQGRLSARECARQCAGLARLGASFLVASLILGGGLLLIRARLQSQLGPTSLGLFEAAWAISMTYLGAIMGAMGTDFYPRLTGLAEDPAGAVALVNDQTRVALWLSGPICVAVIGFAPWIATIIFSHQFAEAATVMRWQVLGDILKVLSWPLGFVLLAVGDGRRFVVGEGIGVGVFVAVVWLGLPRFGLEAAGIGFLAMYLVYLPLVHYWASRRIGFRWDLDVQRDAAILICSAAATALAAEQSAQLGAFIGGVITLGLGAVAIGQIGKLTSQQGLIGRLTKFRDWSTRGERDD